MCLSRDKGEHTMSETHDDVIIICDSNDPKNPYSIEAEQAILGGIMLANGECYPHISFLTANDFFQPRHKFLFEFLTNLINEGIPTDVITTTDHLKRADKFEAVGKGDYLGILVGNTAGIANIVAYARIILDHAKYRELIRNGIISNATTIRGRSPDKILEEHRVQIVDKLDAFMQRGKEQNKFDVGGYTLDELDDIEFPVTQFCVPDLIPEGVVLLCAPPKAGKSFFCLNLCIAKAIGGKLLDRQLDQSECLYLALEDNAQSLKERTRRMLPNSKTPKGITIFHHSKPLGAGGEQDIIQHLDQHPNCKLIIIDTLAKVRPIQSSNSNAYLEDYHLLNLLTSITKTHMGLTILVIHHVRKAKADDIFETISGTTGLDGAADAAIVWGRDGKNMLFNLKGRRVPYITGDDALVMELAEDIMTWQLKGRAIDICASDSRRQVRQAIQDGAETLKELIEIVDISYDALKKLIRRMVADGEIERNKVGRMFKLSLTDKVNVKKNTNDFVTPLISTPLNNGDDIVDVSNFIYKCVLNNMMEWSILKGVLISQGFDAKASESGKVSLIEAGHIEERDGFLAVVD